MFKGVPFSFPLGVCRNLPMLQSSLKQKKRRATEQLLSELDTGVRFLIPAPLSHQVSAHYSTDPKEVEKADAFLVYVAGKIIAENGGPWAKYEERPAEVELSSKILAHIFGRQYHQYRDFFRDKGLFKLTPFVVGKKMYGFGLRQDLFKKDLEWREITEKKVKKNLLLWKRTMREEERKQYGAYADALYWYTQPGLEIDEGAALGYLQKLNDRQGLRPVWAKANPSDDEILRWYNNRLPLQYKKGIDAIAKLKEKRYGISVDLKHGRIYNAVTNMLSPLRNFLKYEGKELVSIDIKNSQPFHFCHVLSERFWAPQKHAFSFRSIDENLFNYFTSAGQEGLKIVRKILREPPNDLVSYRDLATTGELYEYLSEHLRIKYPRLHANREASKQRYVQFLNFDLAKKSSPAYADYRAAGKLFPNVWKVMEILKERRYKDISLVLQQLEARMLLQGFCRAYSKDYPNVPVYTVHDSIITLAEYEEEAQRIIREVYNSTLSIEPMLVPERLNPENAHVVLGKYINKKSPVSLKDENIDVDRLQEYIQRSHGY